MVREIALVSVALVLAGCGGEAAGDEGEQAVTRGEWVCGAPAMPYDLPNDCWEAETTLAEVCTRELDVEQPSSELVQTCVMDASGVLYVVTLGDRSELQAPEGWGVVVRSADGSATTEGIPMHELSHCGQYISSDGAVRSCEP